METRMSSSLYRKQKRYTQKYRAKWELLSEFKYWLKPLPNDSTKAYCSICNVIIKAHLCDLKKHGDAKKHISATKLLKQLKGYAPDESVDSEMKGGASDTADNFDDNGTDEESNEAYRWTPDAVESLLRHLKLRWKEFRGGLRKKKGVWEDISLAMAEEGYNINSFECGRKFRNIKLRYLSVLEKTINGEEPVFRIEYYDDLHELLSKDPETLAYLEQKKLSQRPETIVGIDSADEAHILGHSGYDIITDGDMEWNDGATDTMLNLMLEFKDWFTNKEDSDPPVWQIVAEQMQQDGHDTEDIHCHRKWLNLVEQYTHYNSIAENTGTVSLWPYYTKVRHVMNTVNIPVEDLIDKKPIRLKEGRPRKRGRPKKRSSSSLDNIDSDASRGEERSPKEEKKFKSHRRDSDDNTIRRVRRLGENAAMWERLNSMETRLDDLTDQQELQRATNTLLAQILGELSTLASHLSPRSNQDSSRMRDGITIVVPQSEQ